MQHRPPALFIADALGLDFLNTVATPVDAPVDWIEDGDGLSAWLEQAELVPAEPEVHARLPAGGGHRCGFGAKQLLLFAQVSNHERGQEQIGDAHDRAVDLVAAQREQCSPRAGGKDESGLDPVKGLRPFSPLGRIGMRFRRPIRSADRGGWPGPARVLCNQYTMGEFGCASQPLVC